MIQEMVIGAGEHIVQFYDHDIDLADTLGHYLLAGVQAGNVELIIATEPHRRAFEAALARGGVNVDHASRQGQLIWLDADATLRAVLLDGRVDGDAFHVIVGEVVRAACDQGRPVRIYGEMVGLLWEAGDVLGAIEVEALWNTLAGQLAFTLFCAYPSSSVARPEHTEALDRICHLHTSAIGTPSRDLVVHYDADSSAPASARRFLADTLRTRGQHAVVVADAVSVVSELATNAVVHAQTPFTVTIRTTDTTVRIAVADSSSALPTTGRPGPDVHAARGIALVASLANRWGVDPVRNGKTVWAELRR